MTESDRHRRGEPLFGLGRRAAAVVTIVATVAVVGNPAVADEEGRDGKNNVVSVINERDGSWRTKAKDSIAREPGPTVANENVAFARASCTDCRTVAVAVQAIVVEGPVDDFRPGNAAVAFNESCLRCQTFAYARQEVLYADSKVKIGPAAKDQIGAIRQQLKAVADADIPFDQMIADLDALVVEYVGALQAAIEQSGARAVERSDRKVERDED